MIKLQAASSLLFQRHFVVHIQTFIKKTALEYAVSVETSPTLSHYRKSVIISLTAAAQKYNLTEL
ncbi:MULTISPECIES: hypothetical protein [Paenibacillus]|uniref:hypothetical protein n=1 Tax=Paenibacillus TaxID=44249 RepID=UPI0003D2DE87|nr:MULTISPECIES: hypothetical protein [Paenibacillus]AIW40063.1 hypothetical protein X809_28670 [Paenibacillus polymyxa CR1]OMF70318.1 hypothetical protein BK143_17540 [Paenibacillus peoriae]OMF81244.1 hypothetical protein BK145_07410 [Paenibacillus peoriae]POR28591.1 hypothetical protein CG775_08435 [Paenibacillus polymyxa]